MRLIGDILLQLAMLDAGIIPFAPSGQILDEDSIKLIDKRIESMSSAEQRTVKRKFRKLWKKAVKCLNSYRISEGLPGVDISVYGHPHHHPSPAQRSARRGLVLWYLRGQIHG